MIKHVWKQVLNLLQENKLLSMISILGTALAICMIMVIVILYLVNMTPFKPEVNRGKTYYFADVLSTGKEDGRRISLNYAGYPFIRDCYFPLECAEVVTGIIRDDWNTYSLQSMDGLNSYNGQLVKTDPAFWRLYAFDFVAGAPFSEANFRSGIREAVVSDRVARTLFGTEQAVGRELKLEFVTFRVCGVVKEVSRFATQAFADIWIPYTTEKGYEQGWQEGINGNFRCNVLLKEGYDREDLRKEAEARVARYNEGLSDYKADIQGQPWSQLVVWLGGKAGHAYLRYGVILFVLLLVPALNLSGITLARMRKRTAELGVRRAFGATQMHILNQVLTENLVLTLFGGVLGLGFSYVALWLLRDWLLVTSLGEAGLSMNMLNGYVFLAALFFCLVMNLMSAGIPAWRVSRMNITDSINNG